MELKGANISSREKYNPYDQIVDTVTYFKKNEILKKLVPDSTEKHAFIISPGRQKRPKGVEIKERQLWQCMASGSAHKKENRGIDELVHYVKVTSSERYSNRNGQVICSSKNPIQIPFKN